MCVECLIGKQKKPILFKVTEPSSIPYRTHSACAKRAANPDPPPVIPVPDTEVAQAAYAETLLPGSAPARNVFRYWGSPRACYRIPCCGKGDPSSPLSAKGPEKKSHPRGKPLQSSFPNYHELFEEPQHCKAAGNSLAAKAASVTDNGVSTGTRILNGTI